jgi:carbonic anhydrase
LSAVSQMTQIDDVLDALGQGVERFRSHVFPTRRALFQRLAASQAPKALFLTCADSRIVPQLITHAGPGELFVERNPGNIVPVYEEVAVGVSASIEYAVTALGTRHVIICGHSDCGAVHGLLHPAKLNDMPATKRWLRHGAEATRRLQCDGGPADEASLLDRLTRLNVVVQMENLRTHPSVQAAQEKGALQIHGWVYDIGTGTVQAYDSVTGAFSDFPSERNTSCSI